MAQANDIYNYSIRLVYGRGGMKSWWKKYSHGEMYVRYYFIKIHILRYLYTLSCIRTTLFN